ncbi:bifunctional folylpolyglutamate synthase/dihydrofolate synthase [Suttonella ornithocola]|uniref:Dihydrofolate synthase/folylpolyglutamate synthase n=1 Tax=Suttonella ornithocola TaxID=279832 RepID=A0A380N007_9GAMM|nr:folylpolyglutamate synthase/dihydrofolate synthase family protein [Suttonella ornithocola]SUO97606.1 Bifunctional protein folC [Suttonella ornithocola]
MQVSTPRGKGSLAQWLAWQEAAHPKSWDLGLTRIGQVWQALGAPKIAEHIVSVAGTNGKGSCVCWTEAMCLAHGISVASFSSPHLLDYRERIRFRGKQVTEAELCAAFDAIDEARGAVSLSYFEWSALAAFYLMAKCPPQVAVLEVGLGGRLDAVNLQTADATIFTRIGLDHQDWLGNTIEEIAQEKAGIMRDNQRVVFADKHPPATLLSAAQHHQAKVWHFGKDLTVALHQTTFELHLPQASFELPQPTQMRGEHQYGHLATVAAVLAQWFPLTTSAMTQVMKEAKNPARLMIKEGQPRYIVDVAHNNDSAEILANFLVSVQRENEHFHMVCGMLKDKDHQAVFRHLANFPNSWYLCSLDGERGTASEVLRVQALQAGIPEQTIRCFNSVCEAESAARKTAKPNESIVIMGSFVTVGEILKQWSSNE